MKSLCQPRQYWCTELINLLQCHFSLRRGYLIAAASNLNRTAAAWPWYTQQILQKEEWTFVLDWTISNTSSSSGLQRLHTITFIRPLRVAVDCTWNSVGRPARVSNSKVCFKICFWIQVILFYRWKIQFTAYLKLSVSLSHTHTTSETLREFPKGKKISKLSSGLLLNHLLSWHDTSDSSSHCD